MSDHTHTTVTPGCYRCDLNKDEVADSAADTIKEALREYVGDGEGADETILTIHDQAVAAKAHRAGYELARQDMVSGAFIAGPTYEALRDSFSGRKIAAEAVATLAEDIKKIHKPVDGGEHGPDECWEDVEKWPCPTIKAVERAEA